MQPSTRSVRMIPVSASTVRSMTSIVWTCVQWGLGYLCHIPMTTCDHVCLWARQLIFLGSFEAAYSLVSEVLRKEVHGWQ